MKFRHIVKSALPALGFLSTVLVVLSVWSGGCSNSGLEEVMLDSGPITGVVEEAAGGEIWTFKGIPYAAPPVGDLRWKPPQPVEPWTEQRACVEPGPACPQPGQADAPYLDLLTVGDTAEDCLYLNVWSPAGSSEERLPVMVWIHGGSFETGSGAMAVYDGLGLAAHGVVVVTINYRLGPFGFLAHPALSRESPEGVSGNYGFLDQIAALEWVRDNITGFGGDPGNVTVFGESAGAISILDLLVSPLAEGLFHRAIAQSGILLDYGFGVSTTGNLAQAEAVGEDFAERLGVDSGGEGGDVLARMRAKTADELLAAMAEVAAESGLLDQGLNWKPVADGYVLPDYPTRLWAAGQHHDIPLLIGSNADEGTIFLAGLDVAPEDYETQMGYIFGDYAEEALAFYPASDKKGTRVGLSRMLTEVGFASTARFAAQAMSGEMASASGTAKPVSAYLYQFTRVPMKTLLGGLGAFHGLEIPYVFGTLDQFAVLGRIEQVDRDLAETIMGYWTRFAATGDPNGDKAPEWPRYLAETDQHLELGDTIQTGSGLHREACDLADRVRGVR